MFMNHNNLKSCTFVSVYDHEDLTASLENKQQWVDIILETIKSNSDNIDYSQQLDQYKIENVQQKWFQLYEQLIEKQS